MPLGFLQVMLVQEGGSRSMVEYLEMVFLSSRRVFFQWTQVAMFQHILCEEGIKVDQGIEVGVGEIHGFNKGLIIQGLLNYSFLGDKRSRKKYGQIWGISAFDGVLFGLVW